jgi:uncharacterized protein with LGFP repeats
LSAAGATGSIYWTPWTGAHEIHGEIRDKWKALGWERSPLGYPVTDQTATPDGRAAYNHFAGNRTGTADGSIYLVPNYGALSVYGCVRSIWAANGWETGPYGYPTTDTIRYSVNGTDHLFNDFDVASIDCVA